SSLHSLIPPRLPCLLLTPYTPLSRSGGAGERAGLVAEQLRFEQALGEGRAVHLDQRLLPALREIMQPRRDQLLARAALADHQDRDRKSTRLNSSHVKISYAVFCLKKK